MLTLVVQWCFTCRISLVGFFPKGATPLYKATFAPHVLCCISNDHIPRGWDRDLVDSIKHQINIHLFCEICILGIDHFHVGKTHRQPPDMSHQCGWLMRQSIVCPTSPCWGSTWVIPGDLIMKVIPRVGHFDHNNQVL